MNESFDMFPDAHIALDEPHPEGGIFSAPCFLFRESAGVFVYLTKAKSVPGSDAVVHVLAKARLRLALVEREEPLALTGDFDATRQERRRNQHVSIHEKQNLTTRGSGSMAAPTAAGKISDAPHDMHPVIIAPRPKPKARIIKPVCDDYLSVDFR
jgi:hypothetical protein